MSHNLFETFAARMRDRSDADFITTREGRRYSYRDALDASARLAGALKALGVAPGDRVAVQVDKSPEAILLYLACLRMGGVYLPLNTGYTADEVRYFLDDAEPALFVCRPAAFDEARTVAGETGCPAVETLGTDADGSLLIVNTGGWYKLCCPTSQLEKPDILGAIYRVRRTAAPTIDDPRGLSLRWSAMSPTTGPAAQVALVIDELQAIIDANSGTPLADKVEDAVASLETALEELNKEPPDNQAAVGNVEGAAGSLCDAVTDEGLDPDEGNDLMDTLAGVARQLTDTAIEEAIDAGGDAIEIAFAEGFLAEGDDLRDQGFDDCVKFKDAINKYKDALVTAEGALP